MTHEPNEPLPLLAGYRLIEKIGAGGYGEVWSAEAPGGLSKAIKYIFGGQAEKRATHEARALDKIREVRHPFLLSLERIETVEGRLLIVTELADGSLRDRFRACVEEGSPGIPREELLGYLSDTADALDFLSAKHDLAHLDIKPENLLLVAGHVKVADFGLVKNIGSYTQASLVGGMTPTYAAPEVFRGTPARASDQYSLAILYQEMLTGVLPFHGENAAELTLQHMTHDPDLSPLSEQDRFVIARALSKDASHRYESAVAFVDALRNSEWSESTGAPQRAAVTSARVTGPLAKETVQNRHSVTEVFEGEAPVEPLNPSALLMDVPPLEEPRARFAETPAPSSDEPFRPTPSLFIGVGGTGGKVLRALSGRIAERFGVSGGVATLPMLLLDTDTDALGQATRRGDGGEGLGASDTISLPLRRPQEYRDKADLLLHWLGRRWLYNIPRSLKTEGIRPLGRLALIDHARRTFQRIRKSMADAVGADARDEASDETGVDFREGLRVYIVSSVAGGTGGGITLDLAYAVRAIAERLGVPDPRVIGIMTHSTSREPTRDELARVNAYSWLSELHQFEVGPRGYPGDAGCGLPSHPPGTRAFDSTYFSVLGRRLGGPDFESAVERIAEYVAADALTPAQHVLDACRAADSENESPSNRLRSFVVGLDDQDNHDAIGPHEAAVIRQLLGRWLGTSSHELCGVDSLERSTSPVVPSAVEFLSKTQLDPASLATQCRGTIEASLGGDGVAYLEALLGDAAETTPEEALERIDRVFHDAEGRPAQCGGKSLEELVRPIVAKRSRELSEWVLRQLDRPTDRLDGVRQADAWRVDHLRAVKKDLLKFQEAVDREATRTREAGLASTDSIQVVAHKYFRLRLDGAGLEGALLAVERLAEATDRLPAEIEQLRDLLVNLAGRVTASTDAAAAQPSDLGPEQLGDLAARLEQRVEEQYLNDQGGLLCALATDDSVEELRKVLVQKVRAILRHVGPSAAAPAVDGAGESAEGDSQGLLGFGGKYRKLALVPAGGEPLPANGDEPNEPALTVEDRRETSLRITELSGLSLPHVACELIERRRDYAAFAERTRTRRDVPWVDPVGSLTAAQPGVMTAAVTSVVPVVPAEAAATGL